jgi:hypothetical protein
MPVRPAKPVPATPYEQDVALWAVETARLLRERRFEEIDVENLAEEVEALARSDRRELRSRLRVLIQHLLKWKWQPDQRSPGWRGTIRSQRNELGDLFQQSPSLRGAVSEVAEDIYASAVENASDDTGLPGATFPDRCPWSPEQILSGSFFPD